MSDSENDNLPSGPECLRRCQEFATVTNTDSALAMFYLQDVEWDLERALEMYFQQTNSNDKKVVACFDIDMLNEDEEVIQENLRKEAPTSHEDDEITKKKFKTLSWNIDGLDPSNLESRTNGVNQVIAREKPDLVFFQEVVTASFKIIKENLASEYLLFPSVDEENILKLEPKRYFTMILINKDTCKPNGDKKVIEFNNSIMTRNLLKLDLTYRKNIKILAMTTHLESTVEFAKQRIEQLKNCFNEILNVDNDHYVLFGGDLNIRDSEIESIGGLPKGIYDLWQSTGSRKECLYTWDCSRNFNLTMNGKFKPRCRFDRLYYRGTKIDDEKVRLSPVYFELEGLEKLKSCGRFSSDHWAIQCYFEIINKD